MKFVLATANKFLIFIALNLVDWEEFHQIQLYVALTIGKKWGKAGDYNSFKLVEDEALGNALWTYWSPTAKKKKDQL